MNHDTLTRDILLAKVVRDNDDEPEEWRIDHFGMIAAIMLVVVLMLVELTATRHRHRIETGEIRILKAKTEIK